MQTINRQALAERIHANAVAKGFWPTNEDGSLKYRSGHYAMLVITELSEAVEAHRNGRWASKEKYENTPKTWTPADVFNTALFESCIKDTVEDELADAYIRLLDMWGAYFHKFNIDEAISTVLDDIGDIQELEGDCLRSPILPYMLDIVSDISSMIYPPDMYLGIVDPLIKLEVLCRVSDIDLAWHIEEKMRYNESRPARHGKEY